MWLQDCGGLDAVRRALLTSHPPSNPLPSFIALPRQACPKDPDSRDPKPRAPDWPPLSASGRMRGAVMGVAGVASRSQARKARRKCVSARVRSFCACTYHEAGYPAAKASVPRVSAFIWPRTSGAVSGPVIAPRISLVMVTLWARFMARSSGRVTSTTSPPADSSAASAARHADTTAGSACSNHCRVRGVLVGMWVVLG